MLTHTVVNQAPPRVGINEFAANIPLVEAVRHYDAEWALRKMRSAAHAIARLDALIAAEIERLKAVRRDGNRSPQRTIDFFEDRLIRYRALLDLADPDRPKTHRLPSGTLVARRSPVTGARRSRGHSEARSHRSVCRGCV